MTDFDYKHICAKLDETNRLLREILGVLKPKADGLKCAWCQGPMTDIYKSWGNGKWYCSVECFQHDTAQLSTPN